MAGSFSGMWHFSDYDTNKTCPPPLLITAKYTHTRTVSLAHEDAQVIYECLLTFKHILTLKAVKTLHRDVPAHCAA